MSPSSASMQHTVVSSESEALILVDENDQPIGSASKGDCHDGDGILHRAFSLFIFNVRGELLLQQRAAGKRLWGGYWSNSCCSHPRVGEDMDEAVHRRLAQELGMQANLDYVYKFQYQAHFGAAGSEHELCWVYVGRATSEVRANRTEIADFRYISPADLDQALASEPEDFTPWFRMEWQRLRQDFPDVLKALGVPPARISAVS